ncbi:MAG: hypothetical protein AB7V36_13105 [Bacteroidales bacterium]
MEAIDIVEKIRLAVSNNLGREAIVRKVKNRNQFFILDLAFSYFQKADRNRRNDYRTGFLYFRNESNQDCLMFVMAHSPIMTSFFKANFDFETFKEILVNTGEYRDLNYLCCKVKNEYFKISTEDISEFIEKIEILNKTDFVKTVFAKSTEGKTGIGNIFSLGIARDFNCDDIEIIINTSWDLFLWLYPSKPIFKRDASLNRSLNKITKQCEVCRIKNLPTNISKIDCNGQIEAAHIIAHKNGGSDKLENGLWLCNLHHRLTEGKLEGNRDLRNINVKYMKDK